MNLDETEAALRLHFSKLKDEKAHRAMEGKVFALEHCLSADQVSQMGVDLSKMLKFRARHAEQYWVSCVVHAAEVGYDFNGQEFWDSFAERTPGFGSMGDRAFLRRCFNKFHRTFNGVKPSGSWSKRFTYICWPVAHALLPRDLQVQLAESIFYARYDLDIAPGLEPEDLGELIARYPSYSATSRYEGLLEQHGLVGRIVRALLQDDSEERVPIYPPTLERITRDLTEISRARVWMQDARQRYKTASIKLAGAQGSYNNRPTDPSNNSDPISVEAPILLTPNLFLRKNDARQWQLFISLPSLQTLCNRYPEYRQHVEQGYFSVECHGEYSFPASGLLTGQPRERRLTKFPADDQSIVLFDPPLKNFDHILNAECKLRPATFRLFKIGGYGIAEQVNKLVVRPNNSYLLVSSNLKTLQLLGVEVNIDCKDVHCVQIDVPAVVPSRQLEALMAVGITVQRTVTVTPVGLSPRRWTGTGDGEWLTTERPCFQITCDFHFSSYEIQLNNQPQKRIQSNPTELVYFWIENLPAGMHTLTISTQGAEVGKPNAVSGQASCEISLAVRPPGRWTPGILCHEAFVVDVHPTNPKLDDFLSGDLEVHVEGDRTRKVKCSLVLTNAASEEIFNASVLTHVLPINTSVWSSELTSFLGNKIEDLELLAASNAYLSFESDQIGEHRVRLAAEFPPLRWSTTKRKAAISLRLIDDGVDSTYKVRCYSFQTPLSSSIENNDAYLSGVDVSSQPGLYLIDWEKSPQAIIIDTPIIRGDFKALNASINLKAIQTIVDPTELIQAFRLWKSARPCNSQARIKQRQVVNAIRLQLLKVVSGARWAALEEAVESNPKSNDSWERLDAAVSHPEVANYGVMLYWKWKTGKCDLPALERRHEEITQTYKLFTGDITLGQCWLIANGLSELDEASVDWAFIRSNRSVAAVIRGARLLFLCHQLRRGELN